MSQLSYLPVGSTQYHACDGTNLFAFRQREAAAHTHIQKLKDSLYQTTETLEQSRVTLNHCEAALVGNWEQLHHERLDYLHCREELTLQLTLERERHKETSQMLDRVFKEATRSGEIADRLGERLAVLEAAVHSKAPQEAEQFSAETCPAQNQPVRKTATPAPNDHQVRRGRLPAILQPGYQSNPTAMGAPSNTT